MICRDLHGVSGTNESIMSQILGDIINACSSLLKTVQCESYAVLVMIVWLEMFLHNNFVSLQKSHIYTAIYGLHMVCGNVWVK